VRRAVSLETQSHATNVEGRHESKALAGRGSIYRLLWCDDHVFEAKGTTWAAPWGLLPPSLPTTGEEYVKHTHKVLDA
jgi:hypothetical protein